MTEPESQTGDIARINSDGDLHDGAHVGINPEKMFLADMLRGAMALCTVCYDKKTRDWWDGS